MPDEKAKQRSWAKTEDKKEAGQRSRTKKPDKGAGQGSRTNKQGNYLQ